MARLKKRSDGRYAKQVVVGHKDGKPIKKTVYGKTLDELDKNYRALMLDIERNIDVIANSITVEDLSKEWYRIRKEKKHATSTKAAYRSRLETIYDKIGDVKVKDLTQSMIEKAANSILDEGKKAVAKYFISDVKSIMNYAVSKGLVYRNACANLDYGYKSIKRRCFTEEERTRILNCDCDIREKAIIYTLLYTGMRRGELFALNKEDIDFKNMHITINKTVVDDDGKPYIQMFTKTDAGMRSIPIFLPLYKVLKEYCDTVSGGILFLNNRGNIMASNSIFYFMSCIRAKADLPDDISAHSFRHSFISDCYNAGVDIKTLQNWVGHDDITTTLGVYTHLDRYKILDSSIMDKYYTGGNDDKSKSKTSQTKIHIAK